MIRATLDGIEPALLEALNQAHTLANLRTRLFDNALSAWLRGRGMEDG